MVNPARDPPVASRVTPGATRVVPRRELASRRSPTAAFGESDWLGSYLLCEEGFGFGGIGFVPRVRFFGAFGFGRIGFSPDVLAMSQI